MYRGCTEYNNGLTLVLALGVASFLSSKLTTST